LCHGAATGEVDLTATGGTAPYSYAWSNGATTQDIINLLAGTYTVIVTDDNGCVDSLSATITEPAAPLALTATTVDVLCHGAATGEVDLTATGGTAPYTFAWSNGSSTEDITGLIAGVYTVVVTDDNGCVDSLSATITEPAAPLALTAITVDVLCHGAATGEVDLTATGGTAPYTFAWSNGATTEDIINLIAGTYTVIVTDDNGCVDSLSATITEPAAPLALTATTVDVLCHGAATGEVDLTATGGTAPYTFAWSNGATSEDIINLIAGTYTVIVTDDNGCVDSLSATITEPAAPLALTATTVDVLCHGAATGEVDLTATGGTAPYSYTWSNGATTQDIINLVAGTYTVIVTDDNGCVDSLSATITEPAAPLALTATTVDVLCHGAATGEVDLTATGGTSPYSYTWSSGATTQDIINLVAGTYTVIVTDDNGCVDSLSATIAEPAAPLALTATTVDVLCHGAATGEVDLTATGGTSPYSYTWSNGATTQDIINLVAGTYTVIVTDDNGCVDSLSATITEPAAPLALTATTVDVLCHGAATGEVDLTATGGTAPYTYAWSNGATTQDIINLIAGTYTVIVTDDNGCVDSLSATITEPAAPLALTATTVDVLCHGAATGEVDLTATGGTAPYTFAWSNGSSTEDITGLIAGVYTVVVTDDNGCVDSLSATITEPAAPLALTATTVDVLCHGAATGEVDLTATGGTAPYTFAWSNGATSEDIINLIAGTYTVIVTDDNGCVDSLSATITEPAAPLALTATTVDVLCHGAATGEVDLTATGGTAPYSYAWSNGATTQDIINLVAGTYTVIVTDDNGCVDSLSATITEPAAPLALTATTVDVLCHGAATGEVDLTATGGTAPYSYTWSNGATMQDIINLVAGTYTVIVTDDNGCVDSLSATITEPAAPLALTATTVDVLCHGAATGEVDLIATGGTVPYTFAWSNGATSEDIINLIAGTYTVIVTDDNGCVDSLSATIAEPAAPLALTATTVDVFCHGAATGEVDLTATGGTAPYTFAWSNGATSEDITGLIAGVYTVVVTDDNGCVDSLSATITEPAAPLALTATTVDVLCHGAATGEVDLTATGGTAPYTFAWSNGATTEDITGLIAGVYTVVVTDDNGCVDSLSATITEPAAPLALTATTVDVLCHGAATGEVDLTATGGTAPYSYTWSTGATTQDIINLIAGTYTVIVTDDNGCVDSLSATITEPAAPLALTATTVDVLCHGAATGEVDLIATGGTVPYTFAWSNGATSEDIINLIAGTYTVIVTDDNGCVDSLSATITEPAAPLALTATTVDVLCHGAATGEVDLTATGGTAPYTFAWSNGATSEDIINLIAGTYTVIVTDDNGCVDSLSATITEPAAPLALTATTVDVLCHGAATGEVDLTATGGTAPYTYTWSNGATTQDIINLVAGTYTVIVTDDNGCVDSLSATITEPAAPLALTATTVDVLCHGAATGEVDLTATGGTAPYSYTWSTGATTQDIINLIAGTYTVIVTDDNGCVDSLSATITEPAAPLALTATTVDVLCHGAATGEVDLTATGGTVPYSYTWSNGATTQDIINLVAGTYTVIVTDDNGCVDSLSATITEPAAPLALTATTIDVLCHGAATGEVDLTATGGTAPYSYAWSNGATTQDIINLVAGTYTVIVTDDNGCVDSLSATITEPAAPLALTATTVDVLCHGAATGEVDLTATGGTAPYSYTWSTGATTQDIINLIAGTYTVIVTDDNGCVDSLSATITEPAAPLALTATTVDVLCHGAATGEVDLTATGGTVPYSYTWSNGATTQDIINLVAGTYTVIVTDDNGCVDSLSATITEPAAPLALTATTIDVLCHGAATGEVDLTATGGTAPYSYAWSNGATTQDIINLVAGTYTVIVTDDNGCVDSLSATITEPAAPLALTATTVDVLCHGAATGEVDLTATGGTAPYSYTWSNGATSQDIINLVAGTYTVIVTDDNGCVDSLSATITEPAAPLALTATTVDVLCHGAATGEVDLTATGGTAPYSYTWSNGATTQDIINLVAGTYTVIVTDDNGCVDSLSATITEPAAPLALTATTVDVLCHGAATGEVDLTATGGTAPYTYAWSNGATTQDIINLIAGTYTVIVTDDNGCVDSLSATITEPAAPLALTATTVDVLCHGAATGEVDLTATGGTAPYTYAWSNGATTQDIINLVAGTYTVIVTDDNGCVDSLSATITEPAAPLALTATTVDVLCHGAATGEVDLTATGGTVPYSYTWSNGATTQDIINLVAGTYTVVVTDDNGCVDSLSATITEPAAPLALTATTVDVLCHGAATGEVDLTATGGTAPYSYAWSNGATTQDIINLVAGTYTVVVTDDNGCVDSLSATIAEPAAPLALTATTVDVFCHGAATGEVDLTATGGTAPYTFAWSNGATSEDITGLIAGVYTVVVTDDNGCVDSLSATITEPAAPLALTATTVDVLCHGAATGEVDLTATGGTAPYSYAWTWRYHAGYHGGDNGCVDSLSASPNLNATTVDVSLISATGGTAPYSYTWSNGATTRNLTHVYRNCNRRQWLC
jgi:hypothetical protein